MTNHDRTGQDMDWIDRADAGSKLVSNIQEAMDRFREEVGADKAATRYDFHGRPIVTTSHASASTHQWRESEFAAVRQSAIIASGADPAIFDAVMLGVLSTKVDLDTWNDAAAAAIRGVRERDL